MLTIKNLKYNSVLIQAPSVEILATTFMRFQEHYESPNPRFRNQIFTIGQVKQWYSINYGGDTYTKDWTGFNFPNYVLKPFREGLFDPLIDEEKELLQLLRYRNDNFYIIGANDAETIRHELSHSLFQYSLAYRNKINQICTKYEKELKPLRKYLIDKGYHTEVINDEIQAYVTDNDDKFIIKNIPNKVIKVINDAYNKFNTE